MVTGILIIDDQAASIEAYKILCQKINDPNSYPMQIFEARNIKEGLDVLFAHQINVILLDKDLTDQRTGETSSGIEHIPELREAQPCVEIITLTASQDHRDVVEAMRLGAFSYAVKRVDNEILPEIIKKAASISHASFEALRLERSTYARQNKIFDLPGQSLAIRSTRNMIDKIAQTSVATLIDGETGTGKSCAARIIHDKRMKHFGLTGRPFQQLNLAVLSDNVAEVELFGSNRGAYTGAITKAGHVELANGGTLFIDEIGEATPNIQKKLLQILDQGTYTRMGDPKNLRKAEFHLITATNKNLEEMCESGEFREDLYMRICGFKISVPPLRKRKEDVPDVVKAVLPGICKSSNVRIDENFIPQSFIAYLAESNLKGNIRSVENALSRLLTLAPRGKNGLPILTNWDKIEGFYDEAKSHDLYSSKPISIQEIRRRSFDINDKKFKGYKDFMSIISAELYKKAAKMCPSQRNIASLFKMSESHVSRAFVDYEIKH